MTDSRTPRPIEYTSDLSVCVDCVMLIANGDEPEDPDLARSQLAGIRKLWPEDPERQPGGQWHIELGAQDCEACQDQESETGCEPWFSWHACHYCGSHLGGDRMHAIGWRYTDTEVTA